MAQSVLAVALGVPSVDPSATPAATPASAARAVLAATGVLRNYVVRKGLEGKVLIDIFVRITGDTVAIT